MNRAREAFDVLKQLAPQFIPDPYIDGELMELRGPSFSLPIQDFLEMKAPMGHANIYEENYSTEKPD